MYIQEVMQPVLQTATHLNCVLCRPSNMHDVSSTKDETAAAFTIHSAFDGKF